MPKAARSVTRALMARLLPVMRTGSEGEYRSREKAKQKFQLNKRGSRRVSAGPGRGAVRRPWIFFFSSLLPVKCGERGDKKFRWRSGGEGTDARERTDERENKSETGKTRNSLTGLKAAGGEPELGGRKRSRDEG